jgi:hypothetical protein
MYADEDAWLYLDDLEKHRRSLPSVVEERAFLRTCATTDDAFIYSYGYLAAHMGADWYTTVGERAGVELHLCLHAANIGLLAARHRWLREPSQTSFVVIARETIQNELRKLDT